MQSFIWFGLSRKKGTSLRSSTFPSSSSNKGANLSLIVGTVVMVTVENKDNNFRNYCYQTLEPRINLMKFSNSTERRATPLRPAM